MDQQAKEEESKIVHAKVFITVPHAAFKTPSSTIGPM